MSVSTQFRTHNHYVPRVYLNGWADDRGGVWTYRTLVSHPQVPLWRQVSSKAVAHHSHLYTRAVAAGETDEIERWLEEEFETPAAEPLRKARANKRLSSKDWERLIRFLAAQDARTPRRLREMLARWHETLPEILQTTLSETVQELEAAKRTGKPLAMPQPPAVDAYFPAKVTTSIEPGASSGTLKFQTVAGRSLWLFALRRLLTETLQALLRHEWTIVRAPIGSAWATSDSPVVRLNYYHAGSYDFGGGWGKPGGEIFMPLGPEHLLLTRIGSQAPLWPGHRVWPTLFDSFQRFTFEHADRFIFTVRPDERAPATRPRVVNAEVFRFEADQWKRWHKEQSDAERALL